MQQQFDVVIVGTGFAASFFLSAYLKKARPDERILVLERGQLDTLAWQIKNRRTSRIPVQSTFVNHNGDKTWFYSPAFGGGSNCWWACTPRMLPNDFRLQSQYGVGVDWPISYDELEPYYSEVEQVMQISGPDYGSLYPRSRPYPQPPHRFSEPDMLLKASYPDLYFQQPTARARVATANRGKCCASGICNICPANAKFTVLNEMRTLYDDPRVSLQLGAIVESVDLSANVATGVRYTQDDAQKTAQADLVVLGANALFNPHILLRSGLEHPWLGKGLNEQVGVYAQIDLDGVDNYQGSTSIVGHGYMLYDGEHRRQHAACLIESFNVPHQAGSLRLERGRWRQRMVLKFVFEDLPEQRNYVRISTDDPSLPETVYEGHSAYTQRAIDALPKLVPEVLRPLPISDIYIDPKPTKTEGHIQGTAAMGQDPERSVVDRHLMHHQVRNLLVLGSSAFPTCPPANPTLTLSALSLWAADKLV